MNKTAETKPARKSVKKEILSWALTLLAAVAIALPIRAFVFEPIRVDGRSMQDTLQDGELMLVTKYEYLFGDPERFDVIVCRYPNRKERFVKRIVGLPGDTLSIADGLLSVNGVTYPEDYLTYRPDYELAEYTVPEDSYFVLGDHRNNSNDSHLIGPITREQIIGHTRCVVFPFSAMRGIE